MHARVMRNCRRWAWRTLGITIDDPTPDAIRDLNISSPQDSPVIVRIDPRSSGARAGLKSGDIVTETGERQVRDSTFLRTRLALLLVGDVAEFAVLREGPPQETCSWCHLATVNPPGLSHTGNIRVCRKARITLHRPRGSHN